MRMFWLLLLGFAGLFVYVSIRSQPTIGEREGKPLGGVKITRTDDEWRARLSREAYRIMREQGTEYAFTGKYWDSKEDGVFTCSGCGQPLFDSEHKFDSGTGWPSFWRPATEDYVSLRLQRSWLGSAMEVTCSRCDSHLGHVFEDGPKPTGLRYCINSVALQFEERGSTSSSEE